jgi:hypothetical protein
MVIIVPVEELRKRLGITELKDKIPVSEAEKKAILKLREDDNREAMERYKKIMEFDKKQNNKQAKKAP